MRVFCKYYSDLRCARAQVDSKGMVEVLQFKATVWPEVASESTYEAQKCQNFLGEHPPFPLFASAFCTASDLKLHGRGLGTRLLANVVCPRCALASAVFWLCHCVAVKIFKSDAPNSTKEAFE